MLQSSRTGSRIQLFRLLEYLLLARMIFWPSPTALIPLQLPQLSDRLHLRPGPLPNARPSPQAPRRAPLPRNLWQPPLRRAPPHARVRLPGVGVLC